MPSHPRLTSADRRAYARAAMRAAQIVRRAITAGKLPDLKKHDVVCVDCSTGRATVYDHRDYDRPLDVTAVCSGCNLLRGAAAFMSKEKMRETLGNGRMTQFQTRIATKEIMQWKKEAKKREMSLSHFVRICVRQELRRMKSSPEPETEFSPSGRRE